jgi:hypothetical protein
LHDSVIGSKNRNKSSFPLVCRALADVRYEAVMRTEATAAAIALAWHRFDVRRPDRIATQEDAP